MNECGNGWVDGKMNGRVAEWVDDLVKEPVNEWGMSEWTSVWMSG